MNYKDRFYDEWQDELMDSKGVCGECYSFTACTLPGHEDIGWCSEWEDFFEKEDEQC